MVGGRERGGRFILLSVNNQTAEKSKSAVKCGRGHCGEQFMKGIVGALPPPTLLWESPPTHPHSLPLGGRRRLTREMGKDDAHCRSPVGGNSPTCRAHGLPKMGEDEAFTCSPVGGIPPLASRPHVTWVT